MKTAIIVAGVAAAWLAVVVVWRSIQEERRIRQRMDADWAGSHPFMPGGGPGPL